MRDSKKSETKRVPEGREPLLAPSQVLLLNDATPPKLWRTLAMKLRQEWLQKLSRSDAAEQLERVYQEINQNRCTILTSVLFLGPLVDWAAEIDNHSALNVSPSTNLKLLGASLSLGAIGYFFEIKPLDLLGLLGVAIAGFFYQHNLCVTEAQKLEMLIRQHPDYQRLEGLNQLLFEDDTEQIPDLFQELLSIRRTHPVDSGLPAAAAKPDNKGLSSSRFSR